MSKDNQIKLKFVRFTNLQKLRKSQNYKFEKWVIYAKGKSHGRIQKSFNPSQPSNEDEIELKRGMEDQIDTHTWKESWNAQRNRYGCSNVKPCIMYQWTWQPLITAKWP